MPKVVPLVQKKVDRWGWSDHDTASFGKITEAKYTAPAVRILSSAGRNFLPKYGAPQQKSPDSPRIIPLSCCRPHLKKSFVRASDAKSRDQNICSPSTFRCASKNPALPAVLPLFKASAYSFSSQTVMPIIRIRKLANPTSTITR